MFFKYYILTLCDLFLENDREYYKVVDKYYSEEVCLYLI